MEAVQPGASGGEPRYILRSSFHKRKYVYAE
jgi:hypothetical protein